MKTLLHDTTDRALAFLDELPRRMVAPAVDLAALREAMGGPLPEDGSPAERVTVIKPGLTEIDGCRCVRDPASLPEPVDLLMMAIDAAAVPAAVEQVVATAAVRSVVRVSGGLGGRARRSC